jgi:fructoselysine-6-phosphate deglycase
VVKFDEQKQIDSVRGALALRSQIETVVDAIWQKGLRNLCWLGIGGTWASCLQVVCHMKERTDLDVFATNAAEYCTTGDRRVGQGTCMVISSVTGTTTEIADAVAKARAAGAEIIGFIDKADSPLASAVDHCISFAGNEQLKFFMVADRILFLRGEMPEYAAMYAQFDANLPQALVAVEKEADAFGEAFAIAHKDDPLHYFVGAGTLYGATYSYAMCYWEEMHWIRTKSIHSAEFFHGMLEIVDPDTPVTVFVGEDAQRPLSQRVARFLPRICKNYTIIDTAQYRLCGIDDQYRPHVSHLVMHAVTNRIDAHLEALSGHDMTIRRYYRKMEY